MKRIIRLTESDLTRIVKRVIKEENESGVQMVGQKLKLFTDETFDPTDPADFNVEIIDNPTLRNNIVSVHYKVAGTDNKGGFIQTKCDSLEYQFVDDTTHRVLPVYFTPKGSMIMRGLNKMCGAYASTNKGSDSSFA
jgi:hypothetical protein